MLLRDKRTASSPFRYLLPVLLVLLPACNLESREAPTNGRAGTLACAPDNDGLQLPEGFCALVVAEGVGPARQLTVGDNGDVYVSLRTADDGGGIVALRDTTGDGVADVTERFGAFGGTGIRVHNGFLYHSSDTAVVRYRLEAGRLRPAGPFEVVVRGLPERGQHASKSFAIGDDGWLYVNIGAPSNACQQDDRVSGSPGQDPCPMLAEFGGIWRYRADGIDQRSADGQRFATGIRNVVGIAWNTEVDRLYALQHGRDQLWENWESLYTAEQGAELPSEEFLLVDEGDDFGWPYCYFDHLQNKKVLAPEYGGDGRKEGRCALIERPIVAFPGHWAPNDLLFYTGTAFPERYRQGAFVGFHGSWNRNSQGQQGFKVVFVPFAGAAPAGNYEVFADNFAGKPRVENTGDARFRPMGLAQGPDGSLYISDSVKGRIWRILHRGA